MTDPTKLHAEKLKVLKKLVKRWMMTQDTQDKANMLLSRNPQIKKSGKTRKNILE